MAVLLIALSVVAATAKCTEAQTKAFEKWDHDWSKYSDEGNRAELEKIYADDYQDIGGLRLGADDKKTIIDNDVKNAGSNPNVKTSSHNYVIACAPNTVTIVHRNTNVTTTDGKASTSWSRTTHVLEKRGANWQVVTSLSRPVTSDGEKIGMTMLDEAQAYMGRDMDWYKNNYKGNYVGVNSEGNKYNKTELLAYFEDRWKDSKRKTESIDMSDVSIRVDGDMGYITGLREWKGVNDGAPADGKVRFTRTLVKDDGKWMVIAGTDLSIKAE